MSGWRPEIPSWVFGRYQVKLAYAAGDDEVFQLAKESVNLTLPRFLDLLRKRLHDRYSMNASQRRSEIFYFFAAPQPVDSIALHIAVRGGQTVLDLSYVPYGLTDGRPDMSRLIELREKVDDPEMAGLYLMRMTRKLMDSVA
jgi:hypothetical protein